MCPLLPVYVCLKLLVNEAKLLVLFQKIKL
jgi:hypothetical protein